MIFARTPDAVLDEALVMLEWLFFPVDIVVTCEDKIEVIFDKTMKNTSVLACFTMPNRIRLSNKLRRGLKIKAFLHEMSHLYSYLEKTPEFQSYDITEPWGERKEEKKACQETELLYELFKYWRKNKGKTVSKRRATTKFARAMDAWCAYKRERAKCQ